MFSCSGLAPICPDIVQLILAGRNATIGCVDGSDSAECVRTLGNNFWQAEMLESTRCGLTAMCPDTVQ